MELAPISKGYDHNRVVIWNGNVMLMGDVVPPGSIQTCVTSPPYWGLRAYGTNPQIWGGDPSCDHRLQDTAPGKVITGGTGKASKKQVTNAGSQYGNAFVAEVTRGGMIGGTGATSLHADRTVKYQDSTIFNAAVHATCTLCNAWLGELGSEPIPDCLAWARGEEPCSRCFVCHLVAIFRLVRTALRDDGTLWLNLGDSYAGSGRGPTGHNGIGDQERRQGFSSGYERDNGEVSRGGRKSKTAAPDGLKAKDLIGIPWRCALALQADGWYLRMDNIWYKRSTMPESVEDRPTKCHEYLFLLSKSANYYYDAEAVREPLAANSAERYAYHFGGPKREAHALTDKGKTSVVGEREAPEGRNKRSVWDVTAEASDIEMCTACETIYSGRSKRRIRTKEIDGKKKRICPQCGETDAWLAHFATFPAKLVEPPILAGTSEKGQCPACGAPYRRIVEKTAQGRGSYHDHGNDETQGMSQKQPNKLMGSGFYEQYDAPKTVGWEPGCKCNAGDPVPQSVLDPFSGSGTTAYVARKHGRIGVGIELNRNYILLAADKLKQAVLF